MKYFKLKFLTFFLTALLAFGVGWAGTVTDEINSQAVSSALNGVSASTQEEFTITGVSGAEYNIRAMGTGGSTKYSYGMNTNSYIYATKSAGKLKRVTIACYDSGSKKMNVYTSNSAYSGIPGGNYLTQLTITYDYQAPVTYSFNDDYTFIALKGASSGIKIVSTFTNSYRINLF